MDRHTWPVHRPLNAAEYAKELMLHLSNIIHQTGSGKRDLAKEIDKRDTRIREKDIMLAEKDAQIQEQDAQIREKDSRIRKKGCPDSRKGCPDSRKGRPDQRQRRPYARIHPWIVEVEVSNELLECQFCKKKTKFGKRIGRDQTPACLECISQA